MWRGMLQSGDGVGWGWDASVLIDPSNQLTFE